MRAGRLAYSFFLLLISFSLSAAGQPERKDSLVRLLGCDMLQQVEDIDYYYRKALGNARFEHNSTLLVCDTALWNVSTNIIEAFGNVKIIQNNTVLSSDRLDYIVEENLAKFRGTLVQLSDKDGNVLRTRDLDYNTKDSVAVFRGGGALRDKDGQVIESDDGAYYSKLSTFDFSHDVNMYTDSVFVKTDNLSYNTSTSIALFGTGTNAWKDNNMLSSRAGVYERNQDKFTFTDNVHIQTPNQEAWADTLFYYRSFDNVEMYGHVELLDTAHRVAAVAGHMSYIDSLSFIKMTREPAVVAISVEGEHRDTVYFGADTLILRSVPKCDVDSSEISNSAARLKELNVDPVTEYRRKAYEAAKAAAEEERKKQEEGDPNAAAAAAAAAGKGAAGAGGKSGSVGAVRAAGAEGRISKGKKPMLPAPWDDLEDCEPPMWSPAPQIPDSTALLKQNPDSTAFPGQLRDSTSLLTQNSDSTSLFDKERADSLAKADSLASLPKDSTKVNFIYGIHNAKVFRKDMQMVCDSLAYTDLDSLIRLYKTPVVWNEIKRQYTADSITVVVKNQSIERASLMSNAFIIVQEDPVSFDQIRGAEMMAYFDSTGTLKRFDSMGGASGVFFIDEDGNLATVNKFEAKMLSATLKEGNIQDLNYFETVKSDAYPVVQMKKDEKILKGFDWQPDRRPESPKAITSFTPRTSQRKIYDEVPRASFPHTALYFPGYMDEVHEMLARQDSLKRVRNAERKRLEAERKAEAARIADSLKIVAAADSLALKDSLAQADSLTLKDSLVVGQDSLAARKDSLAVSDSLAVNQTDSLSKGPSDLKKAERERKMAEREKARQDRAAAKEARWAELDARDAAKAKVKEEKALKKKRKQTLKTLKAMEKRKAKEDRMLERYKARYEKRKARKQKSL